jgi:hypothetical protein
MTALGAVAVLFGLGAGEAAAQTFSDSCPADWYYQAPLYDGRQIAIPDSSGHIGRGCPLLIADIDQTQGKTLSFSPRWAGFEPSTAAECNGAKIIYAAAAWNGGSSYTQIGDGTLVGRWLTLGSRSFCAFDRVSGQSFTHLTNAPASKYRLYMRAWNADGSERMASGHFSVNVPLIE